MTDSSRRTTSALAGVAGVLAIIGLVAGLLGFWTLRTATDSERFEQRVSDLLERQDVSEALGRRVVADLVAVVRLDEVAADAVADELEPILGLVLAGVRSRVEDRVAELIRTPEVAASVAAVAGRAHEAAIDVLEGGPVVEGLTVDGDQVRVNLLPLTSRAIGAMQELGLFADVALPELEPGGDPDEQRRQLAAALDRDLPDDFGTPIVFRSDSLDAADSTVELLRDLLVLAKRIFWLFVILGLALAGTSIWLSRERWRAAAFLVAGLFGAALVVRIVTRRAAEQLPDAVTGPGAKVTVAELAADLQRSLSSTLLWYAVISLVILVGAVAATNRDTLITGRRD